MAGARTADVPFHVVPVVHDTGERIPALLSRDTGCPCRVALRWVVRYRRFKTQPQTLQGDLRVCGWVYRWTEAAGLGDLDEFIVSGKSLTDRQLIAVGEAIRMGPAAWDDGRPLPAPSTGDSYLTSAINFLTWAADPANRGGRGLFSFEAITAERERIASLVGAARIGGGTPERPEPITDDEVQRIRSALGLLYDEGAGTWRVPMECGQPAPPRRVFSKATWLRNVTMFETAQELGIRRGEALKLQVSSLPRGRDRNLKVRRLADDAQDSRAYEPAVKTSSRLLPMSPGLIRLVNLYVDGPPPMGRPRKAGTPYLFTTPAGKPLSVSQADSVMRKIGGLAGIQLSWHPLRHRWAERLAEDLYDDPRGWEKLLYLGGWTDERTARWYTQNASQKKAREYLEAYHGNLYAGDVP